jgi:hypothetical protein
MFLHFATLLWWCSGEYELFLWSCNFQKLMMVHSWTFRPEMLAWMDLDPKSSLCKAWLSITHIFDSCCNRKVCLGQQLSRADKWFSFCCGRNMINVAATFYKATLSVTTGLSAPYSNLATIYKQQVCMLPPCPLPTCTWDDGCILLMADVPVVVIPSCWEFGTAFPTF